MPNGAFSKLAVHASAELSSAALTCGEPPAFRPVADIAPSSTQAGRLRLPACAKEVVQDGHPSERRSLSANQAAEPQAVIRRHRVTRWVVGLTFAIVGLALAHPVLAQGCALCYNTAAAAGARGVAALRNGILILMIPPVIIFGVVCLFTLRGRNRFNDEG